MNNGPRQVTNDDFWTNGAVAIATKPSQTACEGVQPICDVFTSQLFSDEIRSTDTGNVFLFGPCLGNKGEQEQRSVGVIAPTQNTPCCVHVQYVKLVSKSDLVSAVHDHLDGDCIHVLKKVRIQLN